MDEMNIKEHLSETDDAFRQLFQQHQAYEKELEQFADKPYLNPEDQLKETEIKKRKLVLKDQMQILISQYRAQETT